MWCKSTRAVCKGKLKIGNYYGSEGLSAQCDCPSKITDRMWHLLSCPGISEIRGECSNWAVMPRRYCLKSLKCSLYSKAAIVSIAIPRGSDGFAKKDVTP